MVDYGNLLLRAGVVFSPAAPIDKKALFAGRLNQLSRVIDAINTKGQHAITYGERGVGKTSLANILHEVLESIGREDVIVNKVNCHSKDDFSSVWVKALREIIHISEYPSIGFEPESKQIVMDLSSGLGKKITPDDIIKAFRRTKKSIVFIFDEFDRLGDGDNDRSFADTMKALSDYGIDGTLVLVGVGDAVEDLITGHESIARSLVQIMIPRMSVKELGEIIDKALGELKMTIEDSGLDQILRLSQGLPHFTHLLGREATRAALSNQRLNITLGDINQAISEAINDAEHVAVSAYQKAISSSHKGNIYREVLLACALTKGDEIGSFTAADVRDILRKITGRQYDIPQFAQHLANFCSEERGTILVKSGVKHRFQYRFNNPLLRTYVVIRGYHDGLLPGDLTELVPVWIP